MQLKQMHYEINGHIVGTMMKHHRFTLASNTNEFQCCQASAIHSGVEVFAHVVDDAWLLACWFVRCARW